MSEEMELALKEFNKDLHGLALAVAVNEITWTEFHDIMQRKIEKLLARHTIEVYRNILLMDLNQA
jgi:hypothetical protein